MAGQSPYAVNAGVNYNNTDSGWAGLFYTVKGLTLSITGIGLYPDNYIASFHSLKFSINKKIGDSQKTAIDFSISNLLESKTESYFKSFNAEKQVTTDLTRAFR